VRRRDEDSLEITAQNILQLELCGFCLIALAIVWFSGDRRRHSRAELDVILFYALLLSTASMLFVTALVLLFDGKPGSLCRSAFIASNVAYYALHAFPIPLAILYADYQLFRDRGRFRRLLRPLLLIVCAIVALAFLSPRFGLVFRVGADNRSSRGPLFPLFTASQFLLALFLIAHIARNRKRLSRRVFTALLSYPFPMLLAAALQTIFGDLILLWPTMALFVLTLAFNVESRHAKTDFLTGAANRRSLDEELERRIESSRAGMTLSGLLLDIDSFKEINDSFGHEVGDRALEDVSGILHASVRVEDHVARMGGDEFVVLADSREPLGMEGLVRRIESAVRALNESGQRPYRLSLSIGRAVCDSEGRGMTAPEFLAILDADMYRRKEDKKPRE
jgi:diguanylate cyclase (GGDEF)-like protein